MAYTVHTSSSSSSASITCNSLTFSVSVSSAYERQMHTDTYIHTDITYCNACIHTYGAKCIYMQNILDKYITDIIIIHEHVYQNNS